MHGLHDKPLSDEAVRAAETYDEALMRARARVAAARNTGDAEELLQLVRSDGIEWTTTALLPCMAAEALIGSDRWFNARSRGTSPLLTTTVVPSRSVT